MHVRRLQLRCRPGRRLAWLRRGGRATQLGLDAGEPIDDLPERAVDSLDRVLVALNVALEGVEFGQMHALAGHGRHTLTIDLEQ